MGSLSTTWDLNGNLQNYTGRLVLLGGANSVSNVSEDAAIAARVADLRVPLDALANQIVGEYRSRS